MFQVNRNVLVPIPRSCKRRFLYLALIAAVVIPISDWHGCAIIEVCKFKAAMDCNNVRLVAHASILARFISAKNPFPYGNHLADLPQQSANNYRYQKQ
jgi:hypothetical protein